MHPCPPNPDRGRRSIYLWVDIKLPKRNQTGEVCGYYTCLVSREGSILSSSVSKIMEMDEYLLSCIVSNVLHIFLSPPFPFLYDNIDVVGIMLVERCVPATFRIAQRDIDSWRERARPSIKKGRRYTLISLSFLN
jgi:hypothetical protein